VFDLVFRVFYPSLETLDLVLERLPFIHELSFQGLHILEQVFLCGVRLVHLAFHGLILSSLDAEVFLEYRRAISLGSKLAFQLGDALQQDIRSLY
jgi:hypothetical protein